MANSASPLVSVICTVKNGSKTIASVLESVQEQSLHEWEMIVVDDGSTDDTSKIVREYADADSRIRLISTDGVGRGRALNLALAHARAEHVANIDADDPCHPNAPGNTVPRPQRQRQRELRSCRYKYSAVL